MANYEQLVLFDPTPFITQLSSIETKVLGYRKDEVPEQIEYIQLELNLLTQRIDWIHDESMRLAA